METLAMKFKIITAVFLSIIAYSCSTTTKISSRWKPGLAPQTNFVTIMSLVVAGDSERPLREKMEKHVAGDFTTHGYTGISALATFGPKALTGLNEHALMEKIKEKNVDAVLLISLLNKKREKYYVPAKAQETPFAINYNKFSSHYNTINERILMEGYYTEDTRYFWECSLYDVQTGKLLYSAISESFDPGSTETLAHQFGLEMIKDIIKQEIISDKTPVTEPD